MEILRGFTRVKNVIKAKEINFSFKNRVYKPNDIEWINKKLDFLYEVNTILLDEIGKVLYNKDIDTSMKDHMISLYVNPMMNIYNPTSFNYLHELSMANNEDLKFILSTSKFAKKGWFYNKKISKKGIFGAWITLVHSRYFDCDYQENHFSEKVKKLIKKNKISDVGITFLSSVENEDDNFKSEIKEQILEEDNPIWVDNIKYINITLDLYKYVSELRNRMEIERLEEKNY